MKWSTREITYVSLFVALAIICAFLTRFMASMVVPFSFIPFIAVFAGAVLGKRLGAYSLIIYVFMGLIGLPVFAGEPFGGPSYIFIPTFGFLLGFIASAFVTGWILEKGDSLKIYLIATLCGIIVTYIIGLPYLWVILNLYLGKTVGLMGVLKIGFLPFILLDIGKGIAAAIIAQRIVSRNPHLKLFKHKKQIQSAI